MKKFYYRIVLGADEKLECLVVKKLELTARETLKQKAVSYRVTQFDVAQLAAIASLQNGVKLQEARK